MTAATATQSAVVQGAALKQYDPAKAIEGMFNGCVTRLGYVLKDPENYRSSTPYILAECSKRFQDALDDCEITILNAKWYLEQKLAENRRKREAEAEAKAKEASAANAAAKRKHDEISEPSEPQPAETPTKRAKPGDESPPKPSTASQNSPSVKSQSKPTESSQQPVKAQSQTQSSTKEDSNPTEQEKPAQDEKKQEQSVQSDSQFNADDYVKPSPPPTSALTNDNEDFFESMFGEPTEDANDMANADDMNLDFLNEFVQDSTLNDSTTNNTTQTQTQSQTQTQTQTQTQPPNQTQNTQQSSLNSFLPGLEQYANQTDDTNTALNIDTQNEEPNPFTSEFEPNIFDSMLNDSLEAFGGDGTDFANVNVGNPDDTNINFDDIFGDEDFS